MKLFLNMIHYLHSIPLIDDPWILLYMSPSHHQQNLLLLPNRNVQQSGFLISMFVPTKAKLNDLLTLQAGTRRTVRSIELCKLHRHAINTRRLIISLKGHKGELFYPLHKLQLMSHSSFRLYHIFLQNGT
jgi:hypothetical protein